jgi:hypothetical protein
MRKKRDTQCAVERNMHKVGVRVGARGNLVGTTEVIAYTIDAPTTEDDEGVQILIPAMMTMDRPRFVLVVNVTASLRSITTSLRVLLSYCPSGNGLTRKQYAKVLY